MLKLTILLILSTCLIYSNCSSNFLDYLSSYEYKYNYHIAQSIPEDNKIYYFNTRAFTPTFKYKYGSDGLTTFNLDQDKVTIKYHIPHKSVDYNYRNSFTNGEYILTSILTRTKDYKYYYVIELRGFDLELLTPPFEIRTGNIFMINSVKKINDQYIIYDYKFLKQNIKTYTLSSNYELKEIDIFETKLDVDIKVPLNNYEFNNGIAHGWKYQWEVITANSDGKLSSILYDMGSDYKNAYFFDEYNAAFTSDRGLELVNLQVSTEPYYILDIEGGLADLVYLSNGNFIGIDNDKVMRIIIKEEDGTYTLDQILDKTVSDPFELGDYIVSENNDNFYLWKNSSQEE